MGKLRKISKPNSGSTLVLVLIAMAFVGILATMVLTMAMSNLQMKQVDRGSKKNFYSAEVALDELRTGLEGEVTEIIEKTYTDVMLHYASKPVGSRNEMFKTELCKALGEHFDSQYIIGPSNYENIVSHYDVDKLKDHLKYTYANTKVTAKNGNNILECKYVSNDPENQYVCLRNICLEYLDSATQLYTKITTDIKIAIPNANFEAIGQRPAYADYAIIANRQLIVDAGDSGKVFGHLYAGDYGIVSKPNGTLNINGNQVIVKGDIQTIDGGTVTIDDQTPDANYQSSIWAKNIVTKSANSASSVASTINVAGSIYIADDVTIDAPNSTVKLSGSYYGYGYETVPDQSSAMIVNRKKSLLDLTGLNNIFIAGRAYIKAAEDNVDIDGVATGNTDSVRTGEAISSKVNQMAYMLPGECIGVQPGNISVGHNPLSKAEYQQLKDSMELDSTIKEVDVDYVLPFSGKKVSYYVDPNKPYVRIFDTTNTSTLVYYYPNFSSEEKANEYFRDYMSDSVNMDMLLQRLEDNESYINLPDNIINSTSSGRRTYAGNVVAYSSGGSNHFYQFENSVDAEIPEQYKRESEDLKNMYKAYTTKLVPSLDGYPPSEQHISEIFTSLLIQSSGDSTKPGLQELIFGKTPGVNHSVRFDEGSYGSFIVVTNPKTTPDNEFDSTNAFKVDSSIDSNVHIIIATGDVEVQSDFNGLIISKGIVKIKNGATVKADPEKVFDLICNTRVRTVFKDYNSFPYLSGDQDRQIDVSAIIKEENWSKN